MYEYLHTRPGRKETAGFVPKHNQPRQLPTHAARPSRPLHDAPSVVTASIKALILEFF
jgi:hypothetical protein